MAYISLDRAANTCLGPRLHVDVVDTTNNTGSQLAAERVPNTVFDLGGDGRAIGVLAGVVDCNALLAVDLNTGGRAPGEQVVLLASANEDTLVAMGLLQGKKDRLAMAQTRTCSIGNLQQQPLRRLWHLQACLLCHRHRLGELHGRLGERHDRLRVHRDHLYRT